MVDDDEMADLFGWSSEQAEQLARVTSRIGSTVLTFVRERGVGGTFHAEQLHDYVDQQIQAAPASADRILRHLRLIGRINYEIINRRASFYRITAIK